MLIRPIAFSLFFLFSFGSYGQKNIVKGRIEDSLTKDALPFATVSVYNSNDTSILAYRLSDMDGNFTISNLPANTPLQVIITHTGFRVFKKMISLSESIYDLGVVALKSDDRPLDEVLVASERPPIRVYNDTVEFNTAAFKTLPNALVEDLLKKLPGVTVARAGEIFVNGKSVNKIVVDGKEFFGSDPIVASRNLPADIIERVQVFDDGDELEKNFGINYGTTGKVINLKLKKGVKKGVFGKTYAGTGSQNRFEVGAIANHFRDTFQVSIIAFSNNLNKPAFGMSEVKDIGGFARSGYSSSLLSVGGGFELDGISFGGTSSGVQTTLGAGFNLNTEMSNKASVNLKYFYGYLKNEVKERRQSEQFFENRAFIAESEKFQISDLYSHRLSGKLVYHPTKFFTITMKPSLIALENIDNQDFTTTQHSHNTKDILFNSANLQEKSSANYKFQNETTIRKILSRDKSSLNISNSISVLSGKTRHNYRSVTQFLSPSSIENIDQLAQISVPQIRITGAVNYSKHLTPTFRFIAGYNVSYDENLKSLKTYNGSLGYYNEFDPILSDDLNRNVFSNQVSTGLNLLIKKVNITTTLAVKDLVIKTHTERTLSNRSHQINFLPSIVLSWNGVFVNYFTSVIEPSVEAIFPISDKTNPTTIQQGNFRLVPVNSNSLYLTFDKYLPKRSITFRFLFSVISERNGLTLNRDVDERGILNSSLVNGNGTTRLRTNGSITKLIKNASFNLSLTGSIYGDYYETNLILNQSEERQRIWTCTPMVSYDVNFRDKIEILQELSLGTSNAVYGTKLIGDSRVHRNILTTEITWRPVDRVAIESSLRRVSVSGEHQSNYNIRSFLNAAVDYILDKNKRLVLRATAFNILNQENDLSRIVTENLVSNVSINSIKRHFLLNCTYNIRSTSGNRRGKEKLLLF